MNSRERVLKTLQFEEPDRVPIVVGVSNATGIKMSTYQGVKRLIGVDAPDRSMYNWPEFGTALVDEETLQRLGTDVRGVLDLDPASDRERNRNRETGSPTIDSWGIGQVEVSPGVWFQGVHPLMGVNDPAVLDTYPWPNMDDPTRVAHVRAEAKALVEAGEYAIMGIPWLLFPLERAFGMQRMDTFLLNMAESPAFAQKLLEKNLELCKQLMGHFLREAGEYLDIIKIGDDLGTQESLLMSPRMYRRILKPIHEEYIQFIKERTNAKVLFHTDGDVFPLIPDFIDMGIDILNPIQTSAGKMSNLAALKSEYGKDIVFCGGIDTHDILPNGTPEQVRDEVHRVLDILGPGGGYMLASVHTIMEDVPPENVLAMVDAVLN